MSTIQQGLLITAIGMGLVFVVIIFLWGLMALMLRITSRENVPTEQVVQPIETPIKTDEVLVPEMEKAEKERLAAATAVAVAMTIAVGNRRDNLKMERTETGRINPWQTFHRTRQLEQHKTRG